MEQPWDLKIAQAAAKSHSLRWLFTYTPPRSSATEHSIRKKMEVQRKLGELEELRRTVEELPPEILNGAKRAAVNKVRER